MHVPSKVNNYKPFHCLNKSSHGLRTFLCAVPFEARVTIVLGPLQKSQWYSSGVALTKQVHRMIVRVSTVDQQILSNEQFVNINNGPPLAPCGLLIPRGP